MSLLFPALLALLPLAAVPIILHLITLQRLRVTELSTFRFLFDSFQRQRSRLRFMEALLTALRTLFLLLLVLAVCRPVLKKWSGLFGGHAAGETILLVDCSASMNARTEGVSALERAKSAALSVVQRLGPDERLTLCRVTARTEEVFRRLRPDLDAVREQIEGLESAATRANLAEALQRVFDPADKGERITTVYLFTDCQASNWQRARQAWLAPVVPQGMRLVIVNVGSRDLIPNRAVIGAPPPRQRAIVGLPVLLRPRVVNHAADGLAELTVKAFVNDTEVARASAGLSPGQEREFSLAYVPQEAGVLRGRYEIQGDRFPDDDTFLFTLVVSPAIRVLLVNGNPQADPFENEALYLRAALTAVGADDAPGLPRQFARSLELVEIPESALSADALRNASVTVLANCGQLNATHFAWLRDYVSRGGGLLILPGDLVKPEVYNDQFFPVPGPQQERLVGVKLEQATGDPQQTATYERLAALDFQHPVLTAFDEPGANHLATVKFFRRFPLAAAAGRSRAQVLARFASGQPALVEGRWGDGTVLVAAFPANARWSNLPLKPEFVPLVLRLINYAQRRGEVDAPPVALADDPTEISVAKDWAPATGTIADAAGHTRPLTFRRAESRLLATAEGGTQKGYFNIEVNASPGGQARTATATIALNLPAEESAFAPVAEAELRELMPSVRLTMVDGTAEALQLDGSLTNDREIWRPMIWLLFVIIGVELLLATLSGPAEPGRRRRGLRQRVGDLLPEHLSDWLAPRTKHPSPPAGVGAPP